MDINKFIDSIENELFNRIRNSKSDAEARRLLKEHQALQLLQTGVKSSVSIELKDWDYECADGCCTTFGTKLLLNGKELEHPNEEILDNSYIGCDVQTALQSVLKELGYEVTFV